jgi:hypothetical protein
MKERYNMNTEIDRTKNMIVYNHIGGLYFEHNNHDYSCHLLGYNGFYDFSGSSDLHQDIVDWVNKSKNYKFIDDLKDYVDCL